MTDKSKIIAEHNDAFRVNFGSIPIIGAEIPGKYLMTQGIKKLSKVDQFEIMRKVRDYDDFTEKNDPYGEHDFGQFKQNENDVFWKIDYYDQNYQYGYEDPACLAKTRRVLTTMLACEY